MVKIMLQFNGKQLTIPINPKDISIERAANNENIDIIGLGPATRKGEPGLKSFTIQSFFPAAHSYFYTGVNPESCVEFIEEIWNAENKNNNVAKIVTLGLPVEIDMYFVIDNFTYEHKAGEEEDIYYTLKFKEYIPYGVQTVEVQLSGLAASRASAATNKGAAPTNAATTQQYQYYTVQRGDCLWNIAKACCGDGSRYAELYNLNKADLGEGFSIYAGTVLKLPLGWTTPANVAKLTSSSSSSSTKSTNSQPEYVIKDGVRYEVVGCGNLINGERVETKKENAVSKLVNIVNSISLTANTGKSRSGGGGW